MNHKIRMPHFTNINPNREFYSSDLTAKCVAFETSDIVTCYTL